MLALGVPDVEFTSGSFPFYSDHPRQQANFCLPRNHSISLIAVQPRNLTVRCIFVEHFSSQMLLFPMPRRIPDKDHWTVGPDGRSSLSTFHCLRLSALCFHGLTNCFSCKLFALINICVAPRVSPSRPLAVGDSDLQTNQVFSIHAVTNSLSPPKSHVHWNQ